MTFQVKLSRLAIAFSLAAFVFALPAASQEVVLKGKNSQLDITGTLISANDGMFVVKTAVGEFEIAQDLVTCEGDGCPQVRDIAFDLVIAGTGDIVENLVPILVEGFASTLDAETVLLDANGNPTESETGAGTLGDVGHFGVQITDYEGEELANFNIIGAEGMPTFEMLVSGAAPIIFADEKVTRKQRDFVKDGGVGDLSSPEQDHVIAVEGYAVVVHPKNAVGPITLEQAAGVMAGKITDWSELGGTAGPIQVYSHDENSENYGAIFELLLEPYDLTLSPSADIAGNAGEMSALMMQDEAGFGILNYHSRRGTRPLPLTNECGMTFYISPFTIKAEEYPLTHSVHVYSRPDVEGFAKDFLEYIDGANLDGLVSKAGLIDLSVIAEIQVDAAQRMAETIAASRDTYELGFMETVMQRQGEYERLSITFRFAPGSDNLDTRGTRDLKRMIAYLALRKPQEVLVVGFTDSKSSFDANLLVTEQRALGMMERIQAAAQGGELEGIAMSAVGYGELSPVGCNSTALGRAINRRVEIWVR